ncbi:MAG TPA: MotA/TolQ/ExbB proton channel family protein [Opitutaceae bacterium]|nr:MotA/TolQ/ExbB proton channel family protein [Opitutaceae bacterium]
MSVPLSAAPILAEGVNIVEVFMNTDRVGQAITILLGIFSIFAWSLMFGKYFELKKLKGLNQAFEYRLREERKLFEIHESFRARRTIPYGDLFADAIDAYWRAAQIGQERGEEKMRSRIEHAENALQRALARQTLRYEASMIFLASIVSGAPFMGLLGTVWGVMVAFSAVATSQQASIQTLAPGVCAALTTTIAGLIVAIPAVFGYNYLLNQVKVMITELENFASSLADRIELETSVSTDSTPAEKQ